MTSTSSLWIGRGAGPRPSRSRALPLPAALAGGLLALLAGRDARADGADAQRVAAARALYDQGMSAMAQHDYATACPRLDQALRLEPDALDAQMALAECFEKAGKLASARGSYLVAEGTAAKANQEARRRKAHDSAEALNPKLATLIVVVPDEIKSLPGLAIVRDGIPMEPGLWGVPLPVDKGAHEIVMTASGKLRVQKTFTVDADGEQVKVTVPAPRDSAPAEAPAAVLPAKPPAPERKGPRVHIESTTLNTPISLYRVDGEYSGVGIGTGFAFGAGTAMPVVGMTTTFGIARSFICTEPCDTVVDASSGKRFYFTGDDMPASSGFTLHDRSGDVRIRVSPGHIAPLGSGVVLIMFGSIFALAGAILVPVGATVEINGNRGLIIGPAIGSLALGAVGLVLGISRVRSGIPTTYSFGSPTE